MSRQLNVSCASIVALLSGMAAAPAIAQAPEDAAKPTAESSSQEIVVTGSLIGRRDYKAVSPIVTLNANTIAKSGAVTLESALNLLPQMGVGTGSSTIQNRTGRSSVNLRGLGENRALVLLNGRRVQPGDPGGAVDLTVIPGALVKSVETITGGASAAYGSDAMAGVVNILLRNDLQGLTANAQINMPEDGKGISQDYSLAVGGDFSNGKGRADLVLSYTDRAALGRKDRDFFKVSTVTGRFGRLIINNASNPPSQTAINTAFAKYGYAAGTVDRTTTLSFNDDLSLFTPAPGTGRTIANYKGGFDDQTILLNNAIQGNQGYTYTLVNPLTRYNIFSHVEYDLTKNVKWFGEGLFTTYRSVTNTTAPQVGVAGSSINIPVTNPFIPADLKPLLSTRATPNGTLSAVVGFDTLPMAGYDTTQNVYQLTTGLNGDVGFRDWSWSSYISHGETRSTSVINAVNLRLIQQLLEASDGGNSLCAGGLNVFVPDAQMSASCLQYIFYRGQNQVAIQQTNANAMLNGGLVALPAGEVKFAAGLSWRNEKYNDVIDHEASAGNLPGELSGPSTGGQRDIQEYFGELNVPILADLPLIKRLEADAGFRRSKYSGTKGVDSYSGNLTWDVSNLVTVRGGYSRAIRAPSLLDLHASGVQASLRLGSPSASGTGGDPCDVRSSFRLGSNGAQLRTLCQALGVPAPAIDTYTSNAQTIFGQTHGNPSLKNEFSDTYTIGLVLNSPFNTPWLSGLRATFDAFDIRIEDAIGQLPLTQALAQCYNLDGVSNPTYSATAQACNFFPRDSTGQITRLDVPLLNLAKYQTKGVDMQLDWSLDLAEAGLGDIGQFNFNLVETYLDSFVVQQTPTSASLDYVGTSQSPIDPNGRPSILPHWRSVATFTHKIGPFESSLRWRYVGSVDDASIVTNPASTTPGAKAYNQVDGSFSWDATRDSQFRFGVNNIGNAQPRVLGGVVGATDNQSYDVVGRTYYVALRHQF